MTILRRPARPRRASSRKPELLEPRVVLSAIHPSSIPLPQIAAIASQVRVGPFTRDFEGLGVDRGARRGYAADKSAQPGLVAARAFIHNSLAAVLGTSNVFELPFTSKGFAGVNIMGVLHGHGPDKAQEILLGAHYDSSQTPGADDAGAGVAGVLEAAEVLARHHFDRTIVFVAFDQEEPRRNGFAQGSKSFVAEARAAGESIAGALIIDQIGYNPHHRNGTAFDTADIGAATTHLDAQTAAIEDVLAYAYTTYTHLKVSVQDGINETDAYRLFKAGFPSLSTIEPLDASGPPASPFFETANDYYHDQNGNVRMYHGHPYIDISYATQMTTGSVAWAALEARLIN